ncbi:MAG: PspA/IM30 family protein [Acidobacteriota bacterium]
MTWLRRLTALVRADAHGALDALEDRPLLLRQHLRDAEEALASKRTRRDALDAEARDLERTTSRLRPRIDALDADVNLALAEGRDDLARFSAQKLLPLRRQLDGIAARRRDLDQERLELDEILGRQEGQLGDLRLRVRDVLENLAGADPAGEGPSVREQDVELELLRRRTAGPPGADVPEVTP